MGGSVPADTIRAITEDAAAVTGIDASEVEIITAKAATWTDGSLGCPEPGMMYTQALVDGYQVIVRVGDQELDYRVGGGGEFRICEEGSGESGSES